MRILRASTARRKRDIQRHASYPRGVKTVMRKTPPDVGCVFRINSPRASSASRWDGQAHTHRSAREGAREVVRPLSIEPPP